MATDAADTDPRRARRGTRLNIGADSSGSRGPTTAEDAQTSDPFESGESVPITPTRKRRGKSDIASAKGAADLLVGSIETLAYMRYRRKESRMTPDERAMAIEGLSKSVQVLPADVVSQISSLSAPVMALFGFMLYVVRLGEMENAYRAEKRDARITRQVDSILANQPSPEPVYPTNQQPDVNGFVVPPKDLLQSLQES